MMNIKSFIKSGFIALMVIAFHLIPVFKSTEGTMALSSYVLMFILYTLVALQLLNIKSHIQVNKKEAIVIIFMFFFVVDSFMSVLEGNFFIDDYQLTYNLVKGLLKSILVVIAVFLFWKQKDFNQSLRNQSSVYFKSRPIYSWIMRVITVLISSFIIYMIIGALAYPFTGPYMEATIKIPSLFENFMIQILRGCGYLVVTLPLMILWDNKKSLWVCLCVSYILFYPVLGYSFTHSLPLPLRLMDGLVLSLHMIAFSMLVVKLLRKGDKLNKGDYIE